MISSFTHPYPHPSISLTSLVHPISGSPATTFDSRDMPPPSTVPARKRKAADSIITNGAIAGPSRSPSSSASGDVEMDEEADEEYEPSPVPSGRGGRGGKRANTSKTGGKTANGRPMSREALRKANHSLIERRRREKINAALGDLREMVPGLGEGISKGGEFKLEVLERTVVYMRELRQQVTDLETRLGLELSIDGMKPSRGVISGSGSGSGTKHSSTSPVIEKKSRSPTQSKSHNTSTSPPTPTPSAPPSETSPSVDPNETDAEPSLPPQFTVAHRNSPSAPASSIASLLSSSVPRPPAHVPSSRPVAPPQANNPTLYLPFPTPSPTSPFLTYSGASSTSTMGATEPSPFLAPLQNMGLFGGVLNLDHPDGEGHKGQDPSTEEAANLLLAFSSPDTLRPTPANGTPMVVPSGRERRSTLESEEFVLDGNGTHERLAIRAEGGAGAVASKTARDILRM